MHAEVLAWISDEVRLVAGTLRVTWMRCRAYFVDARGFLIGGNNEVGVSFADEQVAMKTRGSDFAGAFLDRMDLV